MSLRRVLPILVVLLLLAGPLFPKAGAASDNKITVKWTKNYKENITGVRWSDDYGHLLVYSEDNSTGTCWAYERQLDPATGNETSVWKLPCGAALFLADIDGDGHDEGVVSNEYWVPNESFSISIYKYGQAKPYLSYNGTKPGEFLFTYVGLGDVNNNGYQDLVLERFMLNQTNPQPTGWTRVYYNKSFEIRDGKDLSLIWSMDLDNSTPNFTEGSAWWPLYFDSNNDGVKDLLLFFAQPASVEDAVWTGHLYDGRNGKVLWNTTTDYSLRNVLFKDINNDGKNEMILSWANNSVGGHEYMRFEIRKLDGTLIPHPVLGVSRVPGTGELDDLGAPFGLVYFSANRTNSTNLRYEIRDFMTWKLLFSGDLGGSNTYSPDLQAAHDYNGDGVPELLITGSTDLLIDGKNGTVLWTGPYDRNDRAFSSPFIGIYTYTRTPTNQYPEIARYLTVEDFNTSKVLWTGPQNATMVFGDLENLDNDSKVELVMVQSASPTNSTISVYEIPKSLGVAKPILPPVKPPVKRPKTSVADFLWPLIIIILLFLIVAIITFWRMSRKK